MRPMRGKTTMVAAAACMTRQATSAVV
jgi:hypothetical protein